MHKVVRLNGPGWGRFCLAIRLCSFCCFLSGALFSLAVAAGEKTGAPDKSLDFDDQPRVREIKHPPWFKQSFLDLRQDLSDAIKHGKKGVILYFAQDNCSYCEAFIKNNLGLSDIATYVQRNFDVIELDIWGERNLTDFDGDQFTEREFSILHNTNFTPSLMFYVEGKKLALFLRGYHDPYRFRAALRYVAENIYKQSSFTDYMSRADELAKFDLGDLNKQSFFIKPPYILARSIVPADRPLLVIFESRDCHACDVMHATTFEDQDILNRLERFEVVQLDMNSQQPVITTLGTRTDAGRWAHRLGIVFAPTLIFFDKNGKEIIRLDSVTKVFRMGRVLDYVLSEGYLQGNYQQWLQGARRKH